MRCGWTRCSERSCARPRSVRRRSKFLGGAFLHRLEIALQGNLGRDIGLLKLDAPVAQLRQVDLIAGDGAAHEIAWGDDLELPVEIADTRFAAHAEQLVKPVHGLPSGDICRFWGP